MSKKKKIIIWIVIIAVAAVIITLVAVNTNKQEGSQQSVTATPVAVVSPSASASETIEPTPTPEPTPAVRPDKKDEVTEYVNDSIEYEYYDAEADKMVKEEVTASANATLSYPMELVAKQLFGAELPGSPLEPNSISVVDDGVYIDFKSKVYEANMGTVGEAALLDTVADAYLKNIPGVTKVYVSVDGNDYSTGHIEVSKNSPYKTAG